MTVNTMPKAKVTKVAKVAKVVEANNIPSDLTVDDVELLPAWDKYTSDNLVNVKKLK